MSETIMGMINAFLIFVWPVIFYKSGYAEGKRRGFRKGKAFVHIVICEETKANGRCPICRNKVTADETVGIIHELTDWIVYPADPADPVDLD